MVRRLGEQWCKLDSTAAVELGTSGGRAGAAARWKRIRRKRRKKKKRKEKGEERELHGEGESGHA